VAVGTDDEKFHAVPPEDLREDTDGVAEPELRLRLDVVLPHDDRVPPQPVEVFPALRVGDLSAHRGGARALDAVDQQQRAPVRRRQTRGAGEDLGVGVAEVEGRRDLAEGARGLDVVDGTCPYVKFPQAMAERLSREGYHIVVVGDANHAEIKGVVSYCEGPVTVVKPGQPAPDFKAKKVAVLAQTTCIGADFERVVGTLALKHMEVRAVNTICNDTDERQADARALAAEVDAVVVVGGKNSANTRHLAEICKAIQPRTWHVETEAELLRIAQESVNNARKHSHADNLWVTCVVQPPNAFLAVEDDGRGMQQRRKDSFGLQIMRERAERLGARLSITDRPGGGTRVEVTLGRLPSGDTSDEHEVAERT